MLPLLTPGQASSVMVTDVIAMSHIMIPFTASLDMVVVEMLLRTALTPGSGKVIFSLVALKSEKLFAQMEDERREMINIIL